MLTQRHRTILLLGLWLFAGWLAMIMAMNMHSASFVDGRFIPVGNDSFYHARRILDAAVGERGFYQFDAMIHAPDGSWLTWPWAYDYLMAAALRIALVFNPQLEPMAFLARVPVFWVFVNSGLFLLLARKLGLGLELCAIAMLAFALAPVNQLMHGTGIIDHHFVELTFVLLALIFGLRFFEDHAERRVAIGLGIVLGIAPAFHNGLFILQLPLLIAAGLAWLRRLPLSDGATYTFGISLVLATITALLPSEPFREMQFTFATHSWFHLYIAICTATCMAFFGTARFQFSRTRLVMFAALAAVLSIPLLIEIASGAAFIAGNTVLLDQIAEVRSPLAMYLRSGDPVAVTQYLSWLIVLAPVLAAVFAWRLLRQNDAIRLFLSVSVVFSLLLILAQIRMHPFGYWALILGPLVLLDEARQRFGLSRLAVAGLSVAALAIAYQPPLKYQLFENAPPGLTRDYAATRSLYPILAESCKRQPGIALSYTDDGHSIRYHTDCSVIANNFLLTPQHGEKVIEADVYLQLTPEQLPSIAPQVQYVFARFFGLFDYTDDGPQPVPLEELKSRNAPLFSALLLRDDLPENFELLGELRVEDERDIAFARVFRVSR